MEYKISKVYNNNVVLAKHLEKDVIIVSKGIGFGRKPGDIISNHHSIEKVFHELVLDQEEMQFNKLPKEHGKIVEITREIIEIAQARLGELNENIEKALVEHIEFALERLEMGLSIDNPFIEEIIYFYKEEYAIAQIAGEFIKTVLGIEIGRQEEGFIALHLHSCRNNKTIGETMRNTRIYKQCIEIIEEVYGEKLKMSSEVSEMFLNTIKATLAMAKSNKSIKMALRDEVPLFLPRSHEAAVKISNYLMQEKKILISEDLIAFLAVDIEKLV